MAPFAAQEDLKRKRVAQWAQTVDLTSIGCLVGGTRFTHCLLEEYFPDQEYNPVGVPMGGGQGKGPQHKNLDHHLWKLLCITESSGNLPSLI